VESPSGKLDPLSVLDQHLHPGAAPIGEDVSVIRPRLADEPHQLGEERVYASPHLKRHHRQPQGDDPDHPSHSRSQAPQAAAENAGQSTTVTTAELLRSSRRIGASRVGDSCTGIKPPIGSEAAVRYGRQENSGGSMPCSRIQRRNWFALPPFPSATPATDAPGGPQASIRDCSNASEWMRRVWWGFVTFMKVSTSMRSGHHG